MKLNRIYALVLRFFYLFRHSFDRIGDAFYWPTIDIVIWGLTSTFFRTFAPNAPQIILIVLSGHLFWLIVWRAQYEITVNLLEELWNKNLVNIFVSPIKFSEWVMSFIVVGIIKAVMSFPFAMLVIYLAYKIKLVFFSWYFLPIIFLMFMTGWWVGFFVAGLILRFGTKVQTFAWTIAWAIGPFAAIYYPVSTLPAWAQKIAYLTPASYVFESAREIISRGYADPNKFYLSFVINLIYLILSILFLHSSFKKVLEKGLVKVY
jgi:ABC-2 type transport system permease protein